MTSVILVGGVLERIKELSDNSVQCCVTSPPYWGLRDYGVEGQIGMEPTPAEFLAKMVAVFREVRRVLRADGTCWVNMGDSYYNGDKGGHERTTTGKQTSNRGTVKGFNKRSVWSVATAPFRGAHFATFPPKLIEPCILAGSKPGDTVFDPFSGAGTTGLVAGRLGRNYIGIELKPEYAEMSRLRIRNDAPLANSVEVLGIVA